MGTLSLAQPVLLSETFELLANTGGSNGAGGRSSNAWTVQSTVKGRRFTRANRAASSELLQAGRATDPDLTEITLDTAVVDGAWRVRSVSDQHVYEILSYSSQNGITFMRVRQVA